MTNDEIPAGIARNVVGSIERITNDQEFRVTIINQLHKRIVFPRTSLNEFWLTLEAHYTHTNPRNWKYLAMLALRENSGWTLEHIGHAFGHDAGHVVRCLRAVKREIREQFDVPHGVLSADDGFSNPDETTSSEEKAVWPVE